MDDQQRKGEDFRALHAGEPFVIPNPWDAGSARVLEALGFKAVASTSSGFAFTHGRLDGNVTLDQVVQHAEELDRAIGLPGSIEDNDPSQGIYEISHAVDRIAAAAETAHALPFPFTLTARAENHIRGNPDLDDTIARLQAFEGAGADVLFAPGLRTGEEIRGCARRCRSRLTCSRSG